MEIIDDKDPVLWKIAEKRAAFRQHVYSYLIINGFFWAIWFFTDGDFSEGMPWPVWPMLGWGIGLAFNYFDAYQGNKNTMIQEEYEKLKRQNEKK